MKMKFFTLGCAFSFGLLTNLSAQEVSYKVLTDDPDTKNLSIALNVIDFSTYSSNMSIAYNVIGNAQLGKLLQADADLRRSYNDMSAGIFSPEDIGKGHEIRLGGRFNLSNRTRIGKTRVVLSSYRSGNYQYSRYITVPATQRRILSVRGGIQNYRQICDLSVMPGKDDNIMYYKDAAGNKQIVKDNASFETMHYIVSSSGIYAGISYQSMVNIIVQAEGYGKRGRSISNDFYADILLTPFVTYTLKPNTNQTAAYKNVDINNDYNSKNYMGWRVGWQAFMGRKIGFSTKMELGQQPGNYQGTWYLSIGMGLGIGANVPGLTKFGAKKQQNQ